MSLLVQGTCSEFTVQLCLNSTEILHWHMVCDLIYFVDLLAVSAGTCLNQICVIRASVEPAALHLCWMVAWWIKALLQMKIGLKRESSSGLLMFSEWHAASIGDKLTDTKLSFCFTWWADVKYNLVLWGSLTMGDETSWKLLIPERLRICNFHTSAVQVCQIFLCNLKWRIMSEQPVCWCELYVLLPACQPI